jgi:hypothetical protein
MSDDVPDIKIILDSNNDAVATDSVQGPLAPSNLLITEVEKPTIQVITPTSTPEVQVVPVDTIDPLPDTIAASNPVVVLPDDRPSIQIEAISGNYQPSEYLATMRASLAPLTAFRAVTQLSNGMVKLMDPSVEEDRRGYLGITLNSATAGQKTQVVTQGLMHNPAWSWTTGTVHATNDGVLTQVLTSDSYEVATAVSETQIYVGRSITAAASGTVDTFIYSAPSASAEWVITHNMGRYPEVTLVDSTNRVMMADITYVDINTVRVEFAYATGGSAYLV